MELSLALPFLKIQMAVYFVEKNLMQKDKKLSILWEFEVGEHFGKFRKHCRQTIRADFALNTCFLAGNKQKWTRFWNKSYLD